MGSSSSGSSGAYNVDFNKGLKFNQLLETGDGKPIYYRFNMRQSKKSKYTDGGVVKPGFGGRRIFLPTMSREIRMSKQLSPNTVTDSDIEVQFALEKKRRDKVALKVEEWIKRNNVITLEDVEKYPDKYSEKNVTWLKLRTERTPETGKISAIGNYTLQSYPLVSKVSTNSFSVAVPTESVGNKYYPKIWPMYKLKIAPPSSGLIQYLQRVQRGVKIKPALKETKSLSDKRLDSAQTYDQFQSNSMEAQKQRPKRRLQKPIRYRSESETTRKC